MADLLLAKQLPRAPKRGLSAAISGSYACFDRVRHANGGFRPMELNLIEPDLYRTCDLEAPMRFNAAAGLFSNKTLARKAASPGIE